MRRHALLFSLLALILSFESESAQNYNDDNLELIYGDEAFVSIATGAAQPLSKAPAVATVITAEDIKNMGATDIDEILDTVPGLHVARSSIGYNPIYVFRGIYSDFNPQVLLLINSIPTTNLFHGDRNQVWTGMPVEAISRIEIIRGPGGAVYGADAFAGVINIVTKSPPETQGVEVAIRKGEFNTTDHIIKFGGKKGELLYTGIFESHETDGHSRKINVDAQSILDIISGTTASLAPSGVTLDRRNIDTRLEVNYKAVTLRAGAQVRASQGNGAGIAQTLDPTNRFSSERFNLDISYDEPDITDNFGIKAQISALNTSAEVEKNLTLFPPGSTGPFFDEFGQPLFGIFPNGVIGNPEVFERHYRGNATGHYRGLQDHDITVGAGYYFGDVYKTEEHKNFGINPYTGLPIDPAGPLVDVSDTDAVFLPEDNRENTYVYVQDVWHFADDWELTTGARFDHYSDFGDTVNPRLALVWSTRHNLTTKFLYGEAFRAPSFGETRVRSNPSVLGNPNLEPETLKSYEVAFNYRPTFNLVLDLNLFHYKWEDIIHFVPDANGSTSTAQNSGKQTSHGLEFEANWELADDIAILANFSWQKSKDRNADKDAANAPEKQLYTRVNWNFLPNYSANIQANWVMDRNRDYRDSRSSIDDYMLVDLTLRRINLFGNFELALLAKNIFDEDAREPTPNGEPEPFIPDDLPLAGRSLLGEIRYNF